MRYKHNWPEAREHWRALWEHRHLGRPCMVVYAPLPERRPVPEPVSGEQKYLDAGYIVSAAEAHFAGDYYAGEAFPSLLLLAAWATTCYGATPHFEMEQSTIWFDTLEVDWENPPTFDLDMDDVWFRRYEALHLAVLRAAGRDDFMVGQPVVLPGNDILPLLLGADTFLTCLVDRPEWMRKTILKLARNWVEVTRHFYRLSAPVHDFWYGVNWACFWAPEPFVATQSDISCMISPEMYDEFIVPELDLVGREFGKVWYHLDGPGALSHLPRLCSLDYVKVIQWVPGSGAARNGQVWMDVYKKIQDAGKIVHIHIAAGEIEPLVRELDPGLLCMQVGGCRSPQEARDLLESAERWTSARA